MLKRRDRRLRRAATRTRSARRCCEGVAVTAVVARPTTASRSRRRAATLTRRRRSCSRSAATTRRAHPAARRERCRAAITAAALLALPQPRVAARRRRARRRHRPVGRADRRGPAPRRPQGAPVRRRRAARRAPLPRARRRRVAGRHAATTTCRSTSTREGLAARKEANHYVTGRDGGRDIDLRAFARDGMRLHGRLIGVRRTASRRSPPTCARNLDAADATAERIKDTIDRWIAGQGIDAPPRPRYEPVWQPPSDGRRAARPRGGGVRTVVWARASGPTGRGSSCRSSTAPATPSTSAASTTRRRRSTSSACRGCTPGARAASPASREDAAHVAEHLAARSAVVRAA